MEKHSITVQVLHVFMLNGIWNNSIKLQGIRFWGMLSLRNVVGGPVQQVLVDHEVAGVLMWKKIFSMLSPSISTRRLACHHHIPQ
jgi:hypothetical protein